MAVPRHLPGVDAQMPTMRGGVFRLVHRYRHYRLNRPMDPHSDAGVLLDRAGVSCCQTLARAIEDVADVIPGTTKLHRQEESIGAAGVKLTHDGRERVVE